MSDPVVAFFDRVQQQPQMLSPWVDATIRVDLDHSDGTSEHWLLRIHEGRVQVSHLHRHADLLVRASRETFERILAGQTGILAAMIRHEVAIAGDGRLFPTLRKLIPGPPGARDPRQMASVE